MFSSGRSESRTKEVLELTRMTKKGIQALCKKNKLYQTPELNDVLYLHYQGYRDIECLEEYTGLKCLWLENNAISEIAGLENQKILKCLFLNNNLIKKIENLENCPELDTLNLANNHITRIENCGVDKLPVLTTLILSHNYIRNAEQLGDVVNCKMLSVLDLAHNRIEDILVVKVFAQLPELRVLDLDGNPVVNKIPQYRKTLILECKNLTHLDRRPVFPRDRACAEAWKRGGYEEERREHNRWNKADRRKIRESVNATLRLRNRGGGDAQVEFIPSSGDEDETERSSAPPLEPPSKQQIADSLSIDEDIQYVEYCDPESIPDPEGHREMQKCKICGRVECNYNHFEERPAIQKVWEAPEDILAKSQAVIEGKEMGNTGPKNIYQQAGSDKVNIPNIFSVRYESETEAEEEASIPGKEIIEEYKDCGNTNKDDLYEKAYVNYLDTVDRLLCGNTNKDDLYEKAYVNYLDTVDRLLCIEPKVEGTEVAVSNIVINGSQPMENLLNENESMVKVTNSIENLKKCQPCIGIPDSESLTTEKMRPVSEIDIIEDPETEESNVKEISPNEFESNPAVRHDLFENIKIKDGSVTIDEQGKLLNSNKECQENLSVNKTARPPSDKKKVRLMIEAEVPENHVKIPTTPIPNRKGRKIIWTRAQDTNKRTKIDRGSNNEQDMLDIFSDWVSNLRIIENVFDEKKFSEMHDTDKQIYISNQSKLLSSTFNEFSINGSQNASFQPSSQADFHVFSMTDNSLSNETKEAFLEEPEAAQSSHEGSEPSVLADRSTKEFNHNVPIENVEKTITSIRDFVSSYDSFLHSIEGKLHDLSERCKVSCVPPEYLTEEDSTQEIKQDSQEVSTGLISDEELIDLTKEDSTPEMTQDLNEVITELIKNERPENLIPGHSTENIKREWENLNTETIINRSENQTKDDLRVFHSDLGSVENQQAFNTSLKNKEEDSDPKSAETCERNEHNSSNGVEKLTREEIRIESNDQNRSLCVKPEKMIEQVRFDNKSKLDQHTYQPFDKYSDNNEQLEGDFETLEGFIKDSSLIEISRDDANPVKSFQNHPEQVQNHPEAVQTHPGAVQNQEIQKPIQNFTTENDQEQPLISNELILPSSPKTKGPTYLPELLSSDDQLQGYYTEVGRRNSEIINRLLENPLTKKMSAEEICKDLQETTEEIRRLKWEKQNHREEHVKETVEVVHSKKDDYQGRLELVDNKLVIIHSESSDTRETNKSFKTLSQTEENEADFLDKTLLYDEQGACKLESSSESWDELTEDLTELFLWDERTTAFDNAVGFDQDVYKDGAFGFDPQENLDKSYDVEEYFGDCITKLSDTNFEYKTKETSVNLKINNLESTFFGNSSQEKSNNFDTKILSQSVGFTRPDRLAASPNSGIYQHEDSSEVYQEALSSYVISETSDGPEIFEPARGESSPKPDNIISNKISQSPTVFCDNEVENVWFDSTSSCEVLLGTTFDSTLSSSCWEDGVDKITATDSEGNEVQDSNLREALDESIDKEDSESHPVNFCFTPHGGRYTI